MEQTNYLLILFVVLVQRFYRSLVILYLLIGKMYLIKNLIVLIRLGLILILALTNQKQFFSVSPSREEVLEELVMCELHISYDKPHMIYGLIDESRL